MHYRERLKEWINDHDLKQKVLAKELNISESVISNYLTGRSQVPIEMLVKISQFFAVSTDYLLELDDRNYIEITGLTDTQLAHVQQIICDITDRKG